jgi:hypothetical protein
LEKTFLEGQPLQTFLMQPVQRIPRYVQLLTDLAKKCGPDHPDHANLQAVIGKLQEFTADLNEEIRCVRPRDDRPPRSAMHTSLIEVISTKESLKKTKELTKDKTISKRFRGTESGVTHTLAVTTLYLCRQRLLIDAWAELLTSEPNRTLIYEDENVSAKMAENRVVTHILIFNGAFHLLPADVAPAHVRTHPPHSPQTFWFSQYGTRRRRRTRCWFCRWKAFGWRSRVRPSFLAVFVSLSVSVSCVCTLISVFIYQFASVHRGCLTTTAQRAIRRTASGC